MPQRQTWRDQVARQVADDRRHDRDHYRRQRAWQTMNANRHACWQAEQLERMLMKQAGKR